jgi:hypothetical protein
MMQSLEIASEKFKDFNQHPAVRNLHRQFVSIALNGLILQACGPLTTTALCAHEAAASWICHQDQGDVRTISVDSRRRTEYRPLSAAVAVSIFMLSGYSGLFAYRAWQAPTFQAALRPGLIAASFAGCQALLTRFTDGVDQPIAEYVEPKGRLETASETFKTFFQHRVYPMSQIFVSMGGFGLLRQVGGPLEMTIYASGACQLWLCKDDGLAKGLKYRPLNAAVMMAFSVLLGYAGLFTYRAWQQAPTF